MNIPQLKANYRPLDEILYQGYAPNVISTAMKLGLFDMLVEEPMDARTLAVKLGTVENPTHHLSEGELRQALEASGFGDFTVRPAEDARQYRCLILAARKLSGGNGNV